MNARILVVDDEAYVRSSLAAILRRRRFEVLEADSVAAALLVPEDAYDAVLTDLRMPGEAGNELVRRLSELRPGLPIVVLTAYGTIPSAVQCLRLGAIDYLEKPARPDLLVDTLERALAASRAGELPAAPAEPPRLRGTLRESLLETEKVLVEEALHRSGGLRREAARLLGIDERNLGYFLRKHGLG